MPELYDPKLSLLDPDPDTLTPAWTKEHSTAAIAEGWEIFDCGDSENGRWQLDSLDYPPDWAHLNGGVVPPELTDDAAWSLVANGTKPHHLAALEFLKAHNRQEYDLIIKHRA